jgi:ribonuclease P protein component
MLPLQNRLKSSKEIEYVFSHGFSAQSGFLFLKYDKTNRPETRFAITIGKNFSKLANKRNRAKRLLREEIKKLLPSCKTGYDIVFFFKIPKDSLEKFEKEIEKNLQLALKKARILTL